MRSKGGARRHKLRVDNNRNMTRDKLQRRMQRKQQKHKSTILEERDSIKCPEKHPSVVA